MALASRWADEVLFGELTKLTPAQWTAKSAVNFGSMQGIANHLLLADRLWLNRFTGEGEALKTADAVPYPELADLWRERQAQNACNIAFAEALDPARFDTILRYTTIGGAPKAQPFGLCVAHFFNHQTHHRGQLHALLGAAGIKCPDIDLIYAPAARGGN
ncbi:MAG: damage-inducible protein DinB [Desulfovibrionaceae bacterium CG1_02_65_16]|nr:MAG: damage-inducible protein DinB [Desulfovibrionaceae bacterium CG1_02_65_16]